MNGYPNEDPHDRTHRLAEMLQVDRARLEMLLARKVVIEIGADAGTTEVGKLAFLTICNLATRLGPYVPALALYAPVKLAGLMSRVYPRDALSAQAEWILKGAVAPEGLLRGLAERDDVYDLAISIGVPTIRSTERIQVGWNGWMGCVGMDATPSPTANPFGAIIAAAMAVSRLHSYQLSLLTKAIHPINATWRLDALTLSQGQSNHVLPATIRGPRTLLIGAGALGSGFTYALGHLPGLEVDVDALDRDVLKPTNCNRQLTAVYEKAKPERLLKVEDLKQAWPSINPIPKFYQEFKEAHGCGAGKYEIAVTGADNAEVRREVGTDLPKVIIDGATGGLMIALSRGADPLESCLACRYADLKSDEDTHWARRLGIPRETIADLRTGKVSFTDEVIRLIGERGTLTLDVELLQGLKEQGWEFLARARCGKAKPDRDLPSASVSYVSALCGFLMAAQYVAEILGMPTLASARPTWSWENVLQYSPERSERDSATIVPECSSRHTFRSELYRKRWKAHSQPLA